VLGALSTGTEPLQERLVSASIPALMSAVQDSGSIDSLPEDLQQRLAVLQDRLTSQGSIPETTSGMSDPEARECAAEMTDIALRVIALSAIQEAQTT
jgi:hypothetical protein